MKRPLITAEDLQQSPDMVIPVGARLTPLAQDLLRKRGAVVRGRGAMPLARRLLIANWKSYKTVGEACEFARALGERVRPPTALQLVICPPFTALATLGEALRGVAELGAQDLSPHDEGAHTGEVAARHLLDVGCSYALVGHSERRAAGEGDALVATKLERALAAGLRPVLCVGETAEERAAGRAEAVVSTQLGRALANTRPTDLPRVVVAYEPRWAIGKGVTPTSAEIAGILGHVRHSLRQMAPEVAERVSVLYGGSVSPDNAGEILALEDCNGALVGGAALDPVRFSAILAAGS
ncbi:MAG: triose-phosphate isomerase [Myxococcales bacterium]|nr:triose-phosphate isomerase [Planctomycetota bacterium]MCA9656857.1 triose-phosphate isomerase [Myxococcales bacterium]